jgi:hypothetical protein
LSSESLGSVVVTHPFHPLAGERLAILFERRWAGSRLYVCEGGPLGSVTLPEDATDRGAEPAAGPLTVEVLAALAVVVGAIGGSRTARKDR